MLLAFCNLLVKCSNVVVLPFSASVRPIITDEQKAFIHRDLEIPFEQQKCRDLITLDTLHAYYGGLKPNPTARRLNTYSRRCKYF